MNMRVTMPGYGSHTPQRGDYVAPPKDQTSTKVIVKRGLLLRGEPVAAGSVLTVPKWEANDLVASGRAELKLK